MTASKSALAIILALQRLAPVVPGSLVAVLLGIAAVELFHLDEHGVSIVGPIRRLGLGGANIAAGLSSGMIVNGSLSKTAVNGLAGARTQLSGLIVAALTVLTLLVLTGPFEDIPEATLAAIVIAAVTAAQKRT